MANYRIGDIVRLTRKSIGMSQEELAYQAGVATETISRIESGKHKVTQSTYQKVMEPLNRFQNRSYAVCTSDDVGIIEEKKLLEDAVVKYDYKKATELLEDLKGVVTNNIVNNQYIQKAEALLDYYNGIISAEELAQRLEKVLHFTVEDYQNYMEYTMYREEGYPYTEEEILTLMNLATAYDECGDSEKAEKILYMLLDCISSGYISGGDIAKMKIAVKRSLSFVMQGQERYDESLQLLQEVFAEALKENYGLVISLVAYDITWNMVKINEIVSSEKYNVNEIKKKKRQAYYIAAARNDNHIMEIVQKSYQSLCHQRIEC